jgi:hypothetical protein
MAEIAAESAMDPQAEHAAAIRRRYLIRFEEDTLRSRPLWIRLIIEFAGTFLLVTVAAGSGVINHYVGGGPVTRAAAVIAPGALVMALIYAWGPLSGLHIKPGGHGRLRRPRGVPAGLGAALLGGPVRRRYRRGPVPAGRLR